MLRKHAPQEGKGKPMEVLKSTMENKGEMSEDCLLVVNRGRGTTFIKAKGTQKRKQNIIH